MGEEAVNQTERMTDTAAHKRLRTSMIAGSLYDALFAIVNLIVPGIGARVLGLTLPEDEVYLRFTGVFLIILALFYLLPAIHPGRYLGNVAVAIIGRTLGAIFLFAAVIGWGRPPVFLLLGAGDLLFALLHAGLLARAEGGNPLRHYLR
jgi:hypothetical protein